MEINDKSENGYIEVWLTHHEEETIDRAELTKKLLANVSVKKCKVVFFLCGKEDLFECTKDLLIRNLGCA